VAFAGIVADLALGAVADFGASYVSRMLPSIVQAGIEGGLSGREMLRELRSVGVSVGNERFYTIMGNVSASQITAGLNLGASLTTLPTGAEVGSWLTNKASGFLYQARYLAQTVDPDTGALVTSWNDYSSRYPGLVSRGEALQDIIDSLNAGQAEANAGADTPPQQQILGVEITNIYHMVPGFVSSPASSSQTEAVQILTSGR